MSTGTLSTVNDPTALPKTPAEVQQVGGVFGGSTVGTLAPAFITPEDMNAAAIQGGKDAQSLLPTTALEDLQFEDIPEEGQDPELSRQLKITYYKHPMLSARYVFKNGKVAEFVNGIFPTTDPYQITELDAESRYLGLQKTTGIIDVEELTNPLVALKNKIIREYLAKQGMDRMRANNPLNDVGTANPTIGVGAANSRMAISADVAMGAMASAAEAAKQPTSGGAETFPVSANASLAALRARMPK